MSGEESRLGEASWLKDGRLARLLDVLGRDGEEARVVGGAVRNALLRLPVGEVDVATTAVPTEVIQRVETAGWKAVPTGIVHGTVTVVIGGRPFEVTTLRRDVETFGRKARVSFGRDWQADAERRDFSINALSASAVGVVYDYVGGLADIAAHRVRFIGEPERRIAEDYLRILRFFRFHAYYGQGHPDADGLLACVKERAGLDALSRERVRMELMKLLVAPRATATLAVMAEGGFLGSVLGGVPYLASFENVSKLEAATGAAPDPVRRLGALGVWVGEDAARLAERLRLTNAEAERLAVLEGWWRMTPAAGEQAAHEQLFRLGQHFLDRVLTAWSRSPAGDADASWHALASLPQRWTVPKFPLKAADFLRRGVAHGPAVGVALRAAEAAWIAADFPADLETITAIADRAAREAAHAKL